MTSFLSSLRTPLLDLHYFDSGSRQAPAIILLHGWPDSADGWDKVASALNAAGWRTIVPYLRGFGPTRFLDSQTLRSGQPTALAQDALDLADALGLNQFAVIGHDWGARAAYVLAAQAPERITQCVTLSVGYGPASSSLRQAQNFWYQWFFGLPQGEAALRADAPQLCRHLWHDWSPAWEGRDAAFERAAVAHQNADWLDLTLHAYRHRWNLVEGDPRYAEREKRQAEWPRIEVPTLLLHGELDRCIDAATSVDRDAYFGSLYTRLVLPSVGHFPQHEVPEQVAALIADWLRQAAEISPAIAKEA